LPFDPRFADSNTAEGNGFLRAIKILSTHSFGGEVKPLASCSKTSRHVKLLFEVRKRYFVRPNAAFPSPVPPALLLDEYAGRISRKVWWKNQ
jgi:hypothetical protein